MCTDTLFTMNYYFAPMEGITTYIFRNAFAKYYGGCSTYYTPFFSSIGFNKRELHDINPENNKNLRVVPQILCNDTGIFLTLADKFADLGYDEVNLNLGCPSGTVVAKKKGSGFLSVPDRLEAFLETVFDKSPLPISVKTRIGVKDAENWEQILDLYAKYPIKELIIHPRFQKQFYRDMPSLDAYVLATKKINVPLVYNGNIEDPSHLAALLKKAPATDTVMIGRYLLYNPELITELNGSEPSLDLVRFRDFHAEMMEGYLSEMPGDRPLLHRMKELMFYCCHYIARCKGESDTDSMIKKIRKAEHLAEYKAAVQSIL